MEKVAPVDDKRLGVYGHSYGGFMTMWTVTHTHRFKAAVAGAGIADWVSYYGENGIDQWMVPFFGATRLRRPGGLRRSRRSATSRTPRRRPSSMSASATWNAPPPSRWSSGTRCTPWDRAQLVIYAGEGHHFHKLSDLEDLRGRMTGWFARYLK